MEKEESREIQHLSHNHRLTLDDNNKAEDVLCYGCLQPISSGSVYTCTPCHFFLHKFCAKLPKKITHPSHIEHQLSLLLTTNDYTCDICRQERPTEFTYHCDCCEFFVDIKCTSVMIKTQQPQEMEHGSHKHKLIPLEKSNNFLCDVCNTKHEGSSSSYVCSECGFLVDQECAFLPPIIRHPHHHDHDLTLIHSIPNEYYKFWSCCQICLERVFRNQWVYFCEECRYFVHIKCSPASSAFKVAIVEKKESLEIQHLSHNHKLTLDEDNKAGDVRCYGCFELISSGPVYTCSQCQFFLHKFCAELPKEITHPCHIDHQLSLLSRKSRYRNYYKCDICGIVRPMTFSYHCEPCGLFVDIKCASIMIKVQQTMEMEYGSHKHKLIPIEKSVNLSCDVCARKHEGSSYLCTECGFLVNRECAFLPPTIRHPHHHDHDLTLIHSIPYEYYKSLYCCQICTERVFRNQWVYSCTNCEYFVHIKCSPASSAFKKVSREIQHLSHYHPLTLDKDNEAGGVRCEGCLEPISSGPVYTCSRCQFFLHKFCAELPKQITHPSHIEHQLSLLPRHGRYRNYYECDICRQVRPTEFSYYCDSCRFFVDLKCASMTIKIQQTKEMEHGSHKHKLVPLEKSSNFLCDVCARKHEGSSYVCTECGFWVNQECAFLPPTVKISDGSHPHDHDLTLNHSRPYWVSSCKICQERVFRNQWVYACSKCKYAVHITCSPTSKTQHSRDEKVEIENNIMTSKLARYPWAKEHPEEFGTLVARLIKNIVGREEKKATVGDELRNISHIHDHEPLIFSSDNLQTSRRCKACKQAISTSFYKCAKSECEFCIHQWCAELPKELDHSCHPEHLLHLMTQELLDFSPPRCECCAVFNNTFYFSCKECSFHLDVKCAGIPSGIYHESHDHPLTLRLFMSCSICGSYSGYYAFVCEACSHTVCVRCAFLPGKVSHRYDKHPFTLKYSSPFSVKDNDQVEDEFKKTEYYYCEICEGDINSKRWFYNCDECDQSLHIKCICPNIDVLMYKDINL